MDQLTCPRCGAHVSEVAEAAAWTCSVCGYEAAGWTSEADAIASEARDALSRGEAGRAMQLVQEGLQHDPENPELLPLKAQIESQLAAIRSADSVGTDSFAALSEAENYHLQATFVLNEVQANIQVSGSNSALSGARPANVDLGLQYIDRSLELFPDNPVYLNTKALLLVDGRGDKEGAKELLEKAAALAPRDINIQNNLNAVSSGGCFVATAAFGTPFADEIHVLRAWRDSVLARSHFGRAFIALYYAVGPMLADRIRGRPRARATIRTLLRPLIMSLKSR